MGNLLPTHYFVHLEPDLETFTFSGKSIISLHSDNPIKKVILNAHELEIKECNIKTNDKFELTKYELSIENQEVTIFLPKKTANNFELHIEYNGEINDKLTGFYRSKFFVDGEEKYVAVTQFQESDARRAFPCIDYPGLKAPFDIELVVDENLFAISNEDIKEIINIDNGKKLVKFLQTPKISTYLVFFAVGEFDVIEDKLGNIPVRVLASPGNAQKYGKFGLDFGIKSLKYCLNYYDIEYPISKLDLIATPDFSHGAMENWGAILFRENLLLNYPGITSKAGETRIEEVIAHEIAHQWFGNLVSPVSWKYLWLNESFATFFAYGVIDHYYPEKKIWEYFAKIETSIALRSDAFLETTSIEKPGDVVIGMTVKNAPILYNKGGSILRMIEAYLGKEVFRDGLRKYLKKYAYSVAKSDDLWIALEEVSGQPIDELMKSWILQDGYPLIEVKRKANTLYLSQRRFTYLRNKSNKKWHVPISIQLHYSNYDKEMIFKLLEEASIEIEIREDVVSFIVNTEMTGFYRVKYEKKDYNVLGGLIRDKVLSPIDRWSIEDDLYAFLHAREITLDEYLNIIPFYNDEDNHLAISSISAHLRSLFLVIDEPNKSKIARTGKIFLEKVLDNIGYEPKLNEHRNISSIRGEILFNAVGFSSEKTEKYAMMKFSEIKDGKMISADLLRSILQIGAWKTNDIEWFKHQYETAQTEAEKLNYILAFGKFTKKELLEDIQFYIFEKIPTRNRSTAIASLSSNPDAMSYLWHWYLANLDNFESLPPYSYQFSLVYLIPQCVGYQQDIQEFFENYIKKNSMIKDAVDMALELMNINELMKKAN